MSKQDLLKTQTCILRVNIDCDGCKRKVRKILKKIDVAIDMQQGKVTVTGYVEPDLLIKKLDKSGKHAELWSSGKGENKSKDGELDNVNEQLKKFLQMGGGGKGGGNEVTKEKGGKGQQKRGVITAGGDGKNVQQINFQQFLEQMRSGSKDFTVKDQKPLKADLPSEGGSYDDDDDFGDFSGDEFDDDDDDDEDGEFDEGDEFDDDDDDEFDEDDYDDDEDEGDQHHKQQKAEKADGGDVGGEKAKKGGGGGIMSLMGKVIGGSNGGKKVDGPKNEAEGKNGNESKKGGSPKNGGEGKDGNKSGGGGGGGGGGGDGGGGGKKGGFQDLDVPNRTKGGGGGMGPVGQYQVGPMGQQFLAAPVMNGGGGYYQGMGPMGPMPGNPYQQQQYIAMMNQQRMMHDGGAAYHLAMYGRPPPGYGYAPPPAYQDHMTHMFSDENPGSCSIM